VKVKTIDRARSARDAAPMLFVVGTRPEAIKMVPVILAFRERRRIPAVVISTGQHAAMVRQVLGLAGLTPDVELGPPRPGGGLNALTAHIVAEMDAYVRETYGDEPAAPGYPRAVVVHGDTTSAAGAALASFHLQIPVAHVEAGLRTGDTGSPFPEELNRQLIARIAGVHFSPTVLNLQNLVREGVPAADVFVTGNTAIDALVWARGLRARYDQPALADLEDDDSTPVVTVTAHRRENWGAGLAGIGTGVRRLAALHPDVRFVLPLHPNPAVRAVLAGALAEVPNARLVEPLGYVAFARLLARSTVVLTDSGGIQEEAPALGVPVVVTRETTERTEGVEAGTLELVGTDPDRIVAAVGRLLSDPAEHARRARLTNPYGDGRAAHRIATVCERIAFGGSLSPWEQLDDEQAVSA
jgi:UDP-N-acetylglucosamine 2-epimerase (non-hydrolysing)